MNIAELKMKYHGLFQLIFYGFVGGIAFLADFGSLMFLHTICGINHLISATFGFLLGILVNYILSKRFVFKEQYKSKAAEFILYGLIGAAGLLLTLLFQWLFVDRIGILVHWSKIITTILVFFWNFLGRKFLMYTGHNHLMKEDTK